MPTTSPPPDDGPDGVPADGPPRAVTSRDGSEHRPRRVLVDPGGPVLVEGPVEVELPDGTTARSERFMVAVCACRRSRTYPWCDTSHRKRSRERPSGEGQQQ